MILYLTVLDHGYIDRSLTLYRSLLPHLATHAFAFFCVDDNAADLLEALDVAPASVIRPSAYESPVLARARAGRSAKEYSQTCKSVAADHALAAFPEYQWVVCVDGDMMAFGDPANAVLDNPGSSVLLSDHNWGSDHFRSFEPAVGRFNTGFIAFHNDPQGRGAARYWAERCIEACPSVPTADAYTDQKYAEHLPQLFSGVKSISHKGINVAPWNIQRYRFSSDAGGVMIDDEPLALFHYQGLRILGRHLFDRYPGKVLIDDTIRRLIYRPYITALQSAMAEIARATGVRRLPRPSGTRALAQALYRSALARSNLMLA